jgi:hypothetical protein
VKACFAISHSIWRVGKGEPYASVILSEDPVGGKEEKHHLVGGKGGKGVWEVSKIYPLKIKERM